ncbi:hypothetical protein [Kineosporia succinea]|uniref:Lipoprotein n=2 Tax=Kineosporia succinea TaxID=84632 RepID=A0ABT9PA56_9ACTN|nr:hypothetical protein [Kineosporia succinea]
MKRHLRHGTAVTILVAALGVAGCGTGSDPAVPATTTDDRATGVEPPQSHPAPSLHPAGTSPSGRVPPELAGGWDMVTERGNGFSYEITADGKYVYVAMMIEGDLRYVLEEGGRVAISGTDITFSPQMATLTRTEGGEPGEASHPHRPVRTFSWSIDGDALALSDAEGTSTFARD